VVKLNVYRYEVYLDYEVPVSSLLNAQDTAGRYGITEWSRGRDIRAAGFYGHYTTFAEALLLVASFTLGLLVIAPGGLFTKYRLVLAGILLCLAGSLFLTVTRASWLGFACSVGAVVLFGASRKVVIILVLCALPLVAGGLYYL